MQNKKIGILTTFYRIDPGYSLCAVVIDQLTALTKHGHSPVLFTLPTFKDEKLLPEGVEVRKTVPQLILEPYKGLNVPSHWKEDVAKARKLFEMNMGDITDLIVHDVFFIDTYLPYNIALREADLTCKIYAWTHSAPSDRPTLTDNPHSNRYTLPPRTKLIYLNHDKLTALAEMYGAWNNDVRVVHNSRDPRTFWNLDPLVHRLIDGYRLFDADIITVYPVSTPRMISGKGLDKVIKIHAKLKSLGYKTKIIVPNAHANAQPEQRLISETRVWAAELGIENDELIFTSQEGREFEMGVNPKVVSDLFRIANIFIFPTISENSSLVLLEAMLSGNLLVLNEKVGTLREHAGEHAIYCNFDYKEKKEDNERYYLDLAKIISAQFEVNKSLQVKRRALNKFNYDTIYRSIERVLFEDMSMREEVQPTEGPVDNGTLLLEPVPDQEEA